MYYYQPNCTEFSAGESNAITVSVTEYPSVYAITLAADCRGRVSIDLRFKGEDYNDSFPLVFDDGSERLHFFDGEEYFTDWSARVGNTPTAQLAIEDSDDNMILTDSSYTYTTNKGSVAWDEEKDCLVWDLSGEVSPGEGWICASKGGKDYVLSVVVRSNDGGGGGNDGSMCGKEISESHKTKAADIYPYEVPQRGGDSAAIAFPYDGKTYYMGVTMHGFFYPNSGGSMGPILDRGSYEEHAYDIGFYVSEGAEGFDRIEDQNLIYKLTNAFDSLEVKVWALPNRVVGCETPDVFPAIYESTVNESCAECTVLELGVENRGDYLITASGKIGNKTYETYTFLYWDCREAIRFEYDEEKIEKDWIAQINAFLDDLVQEKTDMDRIHVSAAIVDLPAGEYEGYIIVPNDLGRMHVNIYGSYGNERTILHGGILSNAQFATHVEEIDFVGNGRNNKFAKDGATPNYALTGPRYVKARRCSFTDYMVALDGRGVHKSAINCTFENNGTAILFGEGEGGGNLKKQVLYYPQAAARDCKSFIFDTNFYGGKSPIVSVNFTKTFLIPAGALDGATFTVMRHDQLLARITFAPAAATFSLRRSRSMDVFDATVELMRSEDGKSKSITLQEIPGGRTPTISVPCDSAWKSVEVKDEEGNVLEAVIEDGFIQFVVAHGGRYTITNTTVAETPKEETPAVKPSTKLSNSSSGSSFTTTTTEKNPDGFTTTTKAQNWAKENGIAAGLDLSGNVSRVDFMTMLWLAAGNPAASTTLRFTDASSIAASAMDAMAWAVENGVINGYGDGTVRPKAGITRGAMAAIAQRYLTRK